MELEIFIITYNRSSFLERTLSTISNSKLNYLPVTVLDNCSSDDTRSVCEKFRSIFKSFNVCSNKKNIGLGANYLRAVEMSSSLYTWVLCDDDYLDFSVVEDIFEVIRDGKIELIHVGAHPQADWPYSAQLKTPRQLLADGYNYFKYSSFIPCNIFLTESFDTHSIREGYNNVVNAYPHMPFFFKIFQENKLVYISKRQIVTARTDGQSYAWQQWILWWLQTSKLLSNPEDVRLAFLDQWGGELPDEILEYLVILCMDNKEHRRIIQGFIEDYLPRAVKQKFAKKNFLPQMKRSVHSIIGDALYSKSKRFFKKS